MLGPIARAAVLGRRHLRRPHFFSSGTGPQPVRGDLDEIILRHAIRHPRRRRPFPAIDADLVRAAIGLDKVPQVQRRLVQGGSGAGGAWCVVAADHVRLRAFGGAAGFCKCVGGVAGACQGASGGTFLDGVSGNGEGRWEGEAEAEGWDGEEEK